MSAYPGTIEAFITLNGTSKLSSPDHTVQHTLERDNIVAIETVLGTTAGTAIAKNFSAGDFAARVNSETFGSATINGGTLSSVLVGTSTIQGGTANGVTLGTPIVGTINVLGTSLPLAFSAAILTKVTTLTDAVGTITPNAQLGQIFNLVCGTTAGTRTIAAPINAADGISLVFRVKQNAGATGTLVFDSASYKFSGGTANAFALGTVASAWNYYGFRYNASGTVCDEQGNLKNIA